MSRWRLLLSPPADPYTNMAVDEAILMAYGQKKALPTLRIYAWSPPGFSLGYFQKATEALDIKRCRQEGIPFVRRLTGGEAIFHHHEVTYSLVCSPSGLGVNKSVKEGFKRICGFLIRTYKRLGLEAAFAVDLGYAKRYPKSALCFASYEPYDVIIAGKKLGGNAQKRRKNVIFQHGSIPLKLEIDYFSPFLKSPAFDLKNRVCSLKEVLGREAKFEEVAEYLKSSFEETFAVSLIEQELSDIEESLVEELINKKYRTEAWNLKY